MPELPEVEVLVRHLRPQLLGRRIESIEVRREKVIAPSTLATFSRTLRKAKFTSVGRRGKYILFALQVASNDAFVLLGHLGMTGRMFVAPRNAPEPKHAAVVLDLGKDKFIYQDTRYFGRLTLDTKPLKRLGPEPLSSKFDTAEFARRLKRSAQPIKIRLLDQSLIAGIGNIYASEALHLAGISPRLQARKLTNAQIEKLVAAIRAVLQKAIKAGSTIPLDWAGTQAKNKLLYFGSGKEGYVERLLVYDRAGKPCHNCSGQIRRITQAARSTYYCSRCQR
jgi:formamidopyrimidine-DNA glycosylase